MIAATWKGLAMSVLAAIAQMSSKVVKTSVLDLLGRNERHLTDLGLTRHDVERLSGLPTSYFGVRSSTVLTAYEHGETAAFVR